MKEKAMESKVHDDVRARLELAKLSVGELLQPVQTLKFSEDSSDQEYMLIELDDEVLKHIQDGNSLVIRGSDDDSAVICTDDATFDIKKVVTSNTNILIPNCKVNKDDMNEFTPEQISGEQKLTVSHKEAIAWTFDYCELKRINPDTNRIKTLLLQSEYKGPKFEDEINRQDMFTLSKLLDVVQASEVEIMNYLGKSNICCIEGYWRLLDFGYVVECMGEIFQLVDSESWSCENIPVKEMCVKINDQGEIVPGFIVKHLLKYYGYPLPLSDDKTEYWKLDEKKVCQFFAEMLLRDVGKFNYFEFVEVLKGSMPEGMEFKEDYLKGHSLVDENARPPTISLFCVGDLPLEFDAMFDELFARKEKWTYEEIVPYIEDKCLKGQTAAAILTRYARTSTYASKGQRLFSTRKSLR